MLLRPLRRLSRDDRGSIALGDGVSVADYTVRAKLKAPPEALGKT